MRLRPGRTAGMATIWLLSVMTLVPLYFLVSTALRPADRYAATPGGLPSEATLSNFSALFAAGDFLQWMGNSLLLTASSTVAVLVIASMAAHALTYLDLPGSGVAIRLIASLMIIPPILLVVPLFVQFAEFDLIDSYIGTILIYTGLALPFSIFMLTHFFRSIPRALLDAARIDGAGPLRILPAVVVPVAKPAIVTLAVVTAFFVWNDLLIALIFLQSEEHRPLMAGLARFAERQTRNIPMVMSGVLLSVVPIVALYLTTHKFIVRNLYGGSLRGGQ